VFNDILDYELPRIGMKSMVHIGNDRAYLQHSVDYWGENNNSNNWVKLYSWVHSYAALLGKQQQSQALREITALTLNQENGSVLRCCPFPTQHAPSHKKTFMGKTEIFQAAKCYLLKGESGQQEPSMLRTLF